MFVTMAFGQHAFEALGSLAIPPSLEETASRWPHYPSLLRDPIHDLQAAFAIDFRENVGGTDVVMLRDVLAQRSKCEVL
jgi:hypothetical protein